MGCCPVCGCKTNDLDFVSRAIGGKDVDVCSFCHRQLSGFEGEAAPTEAQIRWLDAVLSKEVPSRDEAILKNLCGLKAQFAPEEKAAPSSVAPVSAPVAKVPASAAPASAAAPRAVAVKGGENSVEALTKRVAALEAELRSMKRRQMIKTIIELGLPFIMLLLLIIIFFASGLADGISQFMDILESDFM